MGFELPNGKTARNLQEQVKFLSEKLKDLYAAVNEIGIRVKIVDELPEEGEPLTIYFVPAEDPEQENVYNEYMWIEDEWELIGSTAIDLSDYAQLSGNNTFTGTNTFRSGTIIDTGTGSAWSLINDSDWYLGINENGLRKFTFTPDAFIPKAGQDLGENNNKWKDLYLSGSAYIGTGNRIYSNDTNKIILNNGSDYTYWDGSTIKTTCNITPYGAGYNCNLGASETPWQNFYVSGNISDGTNSVAVAAISKTRLYRHRFQFTYTGGGGHLNIITNSITAISGSESDFQTAINSAVSVYVNQSDGARALFLSASLSQNVCRWFLSTGTVSGGSVSFGSESITEIQ